MARRGVGEGAPRGGQPKKDMVRGGVGVVDAHLGGVSAHPRGIRSAEDGSPLDALEPVSAGGDDRRIGRKKADQHWWKAQQLGPCASGWIPERLRTVAPARHAWNLRQLTVRLTWRSDANRWRMAWPRPLRQGAGTPPP